MASAAQFEANRRNAALSTGPTSSEGKAHASRNHLKFGLFSTRNCVRPEETQEYTKLSKALWKDLNPVGPVEQMLAVEIMRAAWRLHRCAVAEAEDGENPATQASVDRARASAHASMHRLLNDLRQFQSDRWLRAEVLREGFDEAYIGIADAHRVIKGLVDDNRLKSQTIQTQLACQLGKVGQAPRPVDPPPAPTIRTQSVGQAGQAVSPANVAQASQVASKVSAAGVAHDSLGPGLQPPTPVQPIPRNAPCPCHSGLKYKRCCGTTAPPVLANSPAA